MHRTTTATALTCLLTACGGPSDPALGADTPEVSPAPVDPFLAAYAGCTSSADEVDDDLGLLDSRTLVYDDHGDVTLSTADYLDDARFYDWQVAYTYGQVHEEARTVTTYSRVDGWTYDYTWDAGHVVRRAWDDASDGTVDEVAVYTFDGDQVAHVEWDYGGEGDVDDVLDYTWTADAAGGWSVTAEGVDPNGPYHVEEIRDAELRVLAYAYEDATGFSRAFTVASYSALGAPGDVALTDRQDGVVVEEQTDTRAFDALGRVVEEVSTEAAYDADGLVGSFRRTLTWAMDCPAAE